MGPGASASGAAVAGLWLGLLTACTSAAPEAVRAPLPEPTVVVAAPSGPAPSFTWPEVRTGRDLSDTQLRGRVTVLAFVTTYDVASQAQTRFLMRLFRDHAPRINAVLVVLEQPDNRPLVEAYAGALDVPFLVVMADAATIRGEGAFAGLHHVPSVVVLDRDGFERFRQLGLLKQGPLEEAVRNVERATGVRERP